MIIYKAIFPNGKLYIGQTTTTINQRINTHKQASKQSFRTSAFYSAVRKYGFENIKFEVIKESSSFEEMQQDEIDTINMFNTKCPNGYNINDGGFQRKTTEETKIKMSLASKGKLKGKMSEENKKKISISLKKFYQNSNNKDKISFWRKNRKISKETNKKISQSISHWWQQRKLQKI